MLGDTSYRGRGRPAGRPNACGHSTPRVRIVTLDPFTDYRRPEGVHNTGYTNMGGLTRDMEYLILGYPPEGPTLDLDHREFAYAGNFVMSNTGKAVARDGGEILGAVAFNTDYTEATTAKLRYVTVRTDRRGDGIGAQLLRFTAEELLERAYETVIIAVNNPIAYRACYRAGFTATGETAGMAETVLEYAPEIRCHESFFEGLDLFRDRDLPPEQESCLADLLERGPPPVADSPT